MAKIRALKPEFWTNDELAELSMGTRLFYMGLWNFADDNGVFEWKEKKLKVLIFPYDSVSVVDFLKSLIKNNFIIQFDHEGKKYGLLKNFSKHQKPDKRYWKEIVPQNIVTTMCARWVPHTDCDCDCVIDSDCEGDGDKENGPFEKFWNKYPKKVAKGAVRKSWSKLKAPVATLVEILKALEWQIKSEQWTEENGRFIPNPATYLNQRRWEDEKQEKVMSDREKRVLGII